VGRRVEDHLGAHQDIEWAIARGGEGELFMLQARPVTVKPAEGSQQDASRSAMDRIWSTFGATGAGRR
jgi:phosphoenolpyruvate synthase/pyruvate phosphate dikinase